MTAVVISAQRHLAETLAVLQQVAADKAEADFVVALGLGIEFGEALVGAIFGKHPVERAGSASPSVLGRPCRLIAMHRTLAAKYFRRVARRRHSRCPAARSSPGIRPDAPMSAR